MRPWLRRAAAVLATATALPALTASASAAPPPPAELEVQDGEEAWRPSRNFHLRWRNPAGVASPVAAVHYRVRDQFGAVALAERELAWPATELDPVRVPGPPGAYTAEVWLEDATGAQGAAATAKLRFDDVRPGAVAPLATATWIGRTAFPFTVRLDRPGGDPPLSGIRGYAISIDTASDRDPCAQADRCTAAETDLHGGVTDDSLSIAELPEGTSYLHAVAVSGAGMRSAIAGTATLRVDKTDPLARLTGVPDAWVNHPVALTATATDGRSGMRPDGNGPPPFTAIRIDGGAPIVAAGNTVSASVIGEGRHEIAYYARDLAGNVGDGDSSNGAPNRPAAIARVQIDRKPPSVSFARSQDPLDPELIRVLVDDPASGADSSRGWIGLRRAGSGDSFAPLPAAPSPAGELRARWDSDAYPPGEYEFQATAYDMAGNATATRRRADGAGMTLPNPLKAKTSVSVGFGGRVLSAWSCAPHEGRRRCRRETFRSLSQRPPERTVRYGSGVFLSGRLESNTRAPLPQQPVRIVERTAGGAEERVSVVWSDQEGHFAARLSPGPSREVSAIFTGSRTLTRSASQTLRLGVRGGVRFSVSSTLARIGGPPLVFRGRVAAAPGTIPVAGKSVQLQFRLPGQPWSEFRTVEADRQGRFRYAYRFSDDDSRGARFQFRAYAPPQDGWPYEPGASLPVTVRGR